MRFQLREGFYHCFAGQYAIFLDLPANRYFALPSTSTQAFRQLVDRNGEAFAGAEEALSSLIKHGILLEAKASDRSFAKLGIERASRDMSRHNSKSSPFWRFVVALYSELLTSVRLHLFPLSPMLKSAAACQRRKANRYNDSLDIERWVSAFDRTAIILGRTNRCLVRSLAMFRVLRVYGAAPTLVIGVRSDPFSAHAWVQHDDTVLNDDLEQINNYSPILVLR
ncbi:Transglutaminase-like superfamily protein [compost metagenome]|jgi:hypothetical protein